MQKQSNMNIKPIRTKKDYELALKRMEKIWGAKTGTPQGDELDILATLVDKYEEEHFPIDSPDPIEALKYLMDEKGIDRKDLVKVIGDKSKVSAILSGNRSLSKRMIKALHEAFGIPYEVLMG